VTYFGTPAGAEKQNLVKSCKRIASPNTDRVTNAFVIQREAVSRLAHRSLM
jgi:hypothetical protein